VPVWTYCRRFLVLIGVGIALERSAWGFHVRRAVFAFAGLENVLKMEVEFNISIFDPREKEERSQANPKPRTPYP